MDNIKYANAFCEVLEILKYLSKEDYEKIPLEVIETIEDNCNREHNAIYNPEISLENQEISEETKIIIAIFFRDYWATEEQRQKILSTENYDNKQDEIERNKKFDSDIFKNRKVRDNIEEKSKREGNKMIKYDDSLINRIINKIRNIFQIR